MGLSASLTNSPSHGVPPVRRPCASTSCKNGSSHSRPTRLSSSPKAGAMWTTPVPSVSVTYPSDTTR